MNKWELSRGRGRKALKRRNVKCRVWLEGSEAKDVLVWEQLHEGLGNGISTYKNLEMPSV